MRDCEGVGIGVDDRGLRGVCSERCIGHFAASLVDGQLGWDGAGMT